MKIFRRFVAIALCWLTLAAQLRADILFAHTPAATLYVRVRTSATASVAVALTEGTSNGVGFYSVTNAALVSGGLSSSGTYPYKIFVGTPSTSANDTLVGTGTLYWTGSADLPASANTTYHLGTAYQTPYVAGVPVMHNLMQSRVWYVDDTDGAGDTGTREAPFDTFADAHTAASPGDTIFILAGTYSTAISCTKQGIRICGEGNTTIVSVANGSASAAAITLDDGNTLENLTVTATSDGDAVNIAGEVDCTVRRCVITGVRYGINANTTTRAQIERNTVLANGVGIKCTQAVSPKIWHNDLTLTGTYATENAAIDCKNNVHTEIIGCYIASIRSVANSVALEGVQLGSLSDNQVLMKDCYISVTNTDATETAAVSGITTAAPDHVQATLENVTAIVSNTGSGATYALDLDSDTNSLSRVRLKNCHIPSIREKTAGVQVFHDTELNVPAFASHKAMFDGTGYAGGTIKLQSDVRQFGGTNGTFASGRAEVNTTHLAGTSQTARDIGASVLLSPGTGSGQVSLSSGLVSIATGGITSASFASGAINNAALNSDARIGVDWSRISNPTTTLALTGTTIDLIDNALDAGAVAATGATEIGAASAAAGGTVAAFLIDQDHIFRFDTPTQTTAPNIITEVAGTPAVLIGMDFTEPMPANASIQSITSVTVVDVASVTEPTITTSALSPNKKSVYVTTNATSATAATHTFKITILTTDSQTFIRYGRLELQ
jgi:hypothetical protein